MTAHTSPATTDGTVGTSAAPREKTRLTRRVLEHSATRFAATAAVSFGLNFSLTVFFCEVVGLSATGGFGLALAIVYVINFLSLRYFIFRINHVSATRQFVWVTAFAGLMRVVECLVFACVDALGILDYRLLVVAVLLTFSTGKYLFYSAVFGRSKPAGGRNDSPAASWQVARKRRYSARG